MGFYRKETHQYVTIILFLPEFSSADSSVATCVLAVPGLCRLLWCTCFSFPGTRRVVGIYLGTYNIYYIAGFNIPPFPFRRS